jgi:hypothetical protein
MHKWVRSVPWSLALVALPVLLVPLAWWGGWWLISADLAWLAIATHRTHLSSDLPVRHMAGRRPGRGPFSTAGSPLGPVPTVGDWPCRAVAVRVV